jgi:hypothetical protein
MKAQVFPVAARQVQVKGCQNLPVTITMTMNFKLKHHDASATQTLEGCHSDLRSYTLDRRSVFFTPVSLSPTGCRSPARTKRGKAGLP